MKKEPLIFIVDADRSYNRFVDLYLKRNGYTNINCYFSGEKFLENLNLKPDIIILDYDFSDLSLNSMNGLKVLCEIKKELPDTNVIMMSDAMLSGHKKLIEMRRKYCITKYILKGKTDIILLKETINKIAGRNMYNSYRRIMEPNFAWAN